MNLPVLVAGAGPVGLTMALELARFGVPVRIIDKAPERTTLSKALVLWSRTLELLARDADVRDFTEAGLKVSAANIIVGEKTIGHASTRTLRTPFPYALMLPQSETERLLEARLHARGIVVERQVSLESFEDRGSAVDARLRHADGCEECVEAAWLIGCDGAHSGVRHGLDLPFSGTTTDTHWILADVRLDGFPHPADEITSFWHQDGVLAVFPISPGRYRVIADVGGPPEGDPAGPTVEQVQGLIDRRGPRGVTVHDPVWLSAFRVNERIAASYRKGRVFVAGDAAHVHSPAGGQGMNTGMQDAFNLSWKLALVYRGAARAGLLDSYGPERQAVGHLVLRNASRLTELATLRNPVAQHLRNLVGHFMLGLAPVRRAMVASMAEVSIAYEDSPLNGPAAIGLHPSPGERLAPIDGVRPCSGPDAAPRFVLHAQRDPAVEQLLLAFPTLVDPEVRAPATPEGIWLLRPDGYVAATAQRGELGPVHGYLAAQAPPR